MSQQTATQVQVPTLADLVGHLSRFEGPPEQFLFHLLAVQCHIASAEGGCILRAGAKGSIEILSVFPAPEPNQSAPVWLSRSVEVAPRVLSTAQTVVDALRSHDEVYEQTPSQHLLLLPLPGGSGVRGVAAFYLPTNHQAVIEQSRQRLELTISLLSLYEMRLTLQQRRADLQRLKQGLQILAAVNDHHRFKAAAMALCNEVASGWQADRVSLGFQKGRYVRLQAMSHTEKFTRKMKLVQDLESAMEECLDQDIEVLHPPPPGSAFVCRAAANLSGAHGRTGVISLPLRYMQRTLGVLTVERPMDEPLTVEQIETLRLVCELCASRLADLFEHDKWAGAKAAGALRKGAAYLLGPEHTWAKLTAVGLLAAALFLVFARDTDWAEGPFVLETVKLQIIPAPFDGFIADVAVEKGDPVRAHLTELATLDTSELQVQKAQEEAEMFRYQKEESLARSQAKEAEAQIARANAERIRARIQVLEDRIARSTLRSPIDGVVVTGDLEKMRGGPVQMGQKLFEIAPVDSLRAEVAVPEKRIAAVVGREGQPIKGELAATSHPGVYVPFRVERISPMAEVVENRNVFKVRVVLEAGPELAKLAPSLKPGMEGIAKIDTGRRSYAEIWTRDLINWIRMKLWI